MRARFSLTIANELESDRCENCMIISCCRLSLLIQYTCTLLSTHIASSKTSASMRKLLFKGAKRAVMRRSMAVGLSAASMVALSAGVAHADGGHLAPQATPPPSAVLSAVSGTGGALPAAAAAILPPAAGSLTYWCAALHCAACVWCIR